MVDNLRVATSVIPAAHRHGVDSLLYLASSCTYPRETAQPMRPEAMFTGPLEPTSEAYATAKIAGLVLCLCCNVYRPCQRDDADGYGQL